MRMFAAVLPPPEAVEDLEEFLQPRRDRQDRLGWTPAAKWHVTLAFLPSVADRDLDELIDGLAGAAARQAGFSLQLCGAGTFPNPAVAKVLWTGLAGDTDRLVQLAAASRTAAGRAGVTVDGGPYRPHLTVARLRQPQDVTRWLRVLDTYAGPSWAVEEVALMQSIPAGRGTPSRYEVVATVPLA